LRLPDVFEITGWCENGDQLTATCRCVGGVWQETDMSSENARVKRKRVPIDPWLE
jgi:hypothetical protein